MAIKVKRSSLLSERGN